MRRLGARTLIRVVAASLAVLAGIARSAAADIEVSLRHDRGELVVNAIAMIDGDADVAWRVLTDYGRYPEFVPGVRDCRIVRRDGSAVTVEQAGSAFVGPVQVPVAIVYEIVESPPDRLWSSAEIATIGTLRSQYALTPNAAGLRLEYAGRLEVRSPALRPLEEFVLRQTVTTQLQALADEIERHGRSRSKPAPLASAVDDGIPRTLAVVANARGCRAGRARPAHAAQECAA